MLRFYFDAPSETCQPTVDFTVDSDFSVAPLTVAATVNPPVADYASDTEYRVLSARAALPQIALTTDDLAGLRVDVEVEFTDCAGGVFDSPALYQGLTFIDFPTVYDEQSINNGWTLPGASDATATSCGTGSSPDCPNTDTFLAR